MREVGIIIRREFLERVRARAFLFGTLLFPLFMIAIFALPALFQGDSVSRRFALVDEAPPPIGDRFATLLASPPDSAGTNRYALERVAGTYAQTRDELIARVAREEIDGYLVLPADITDGNTIVYRARNVVNEGVMRDIRNAATGAVQAERLRQAGLELDDVTALTRRIEVDDASITETGSEGQGGTATFFFAYILAFLIYFITAFYGMNVLRGVLEEKSNRIAEVMISSVKANHLMLGKIVGVGSAALLQVGIWALVVGIITTRSDLVADQVGVPREAFAVLDIAPVNGVLYILYFILGFLLFAAVFAAVGAAMTTEQEAQSLQMVVLLPLILPLLLSFSIAGEPLSPMATVLGLVPFTSPIAMPIRLATARISPLEIAASLTLLVAGLFVIAWLGGKIYRIGILSTGKRPTLGELVHWLREA